MIFRLSLRLSVPAAAADPTADTRWWISSRSSLIFIFTNFSRICMKVKDSGLIRIWMQLFTAKLCHFYSILLFPPLLFSPFSTKCLTSQMKMVCRFALYKMYFLDFDFYFSFLLSCPLDKCPAVRLPDQPSPPDKWGRCNNPGKRDGKYFVDQFIKNI